MAKSAASIRNAIAPVSSNPKYLKNIRIVRRNTNVIRKIGRGAIK